eukprot:NODE_9_length_47730_cov_0.323718.p7 type:complete len:379 gc:universal NODE_9_length_47730_cov_0.323718:31212-32348(+)
MEATIYPSISRLLDTKIHVPVHIHVYNILDIERNGVLPKDISFSKMQKSKIFGKSIINGLKLFKQQRLKEISILIKVLNTTRVVQTNSDRCFKETLVIDLFDTNISTINITAVVSNIEYYGESYVYPIDGYAVISDIDDTMRIADGYDLYQLLSSSLYYNYTPVEGMPSLYENWRKNNNCRFYYVTTSPDQLYKEVSNLIKTYNFPKGHYMGRHFRWYYNDSQVSHSDTIAKLMPSEGNIMINEHRQAVVNDTAYQQADKDMTETIQHILTEQDREMLIYNHKYLSIYELVDSHPLTKFVLIGDDTAQDTYIFSKIYSHFPNRIKKIYIRHVCKNHHLLLKSSSAREIQNLQDAKNALKNTPHVIFLHPSELPINFNF